MDVRHLAPALGWAPLEGLYLAATLTLSSTIMFGVQLVGRRGADAFLMRAAIALKALFAQDPATARPVPDVACLAQQPATDPLAHPVRRGEPAALAPWAFPYSHFLHLYIA